MSGFKENTYSYLSENVYNTVVNLRKATPPTTSLCLTQDYLFNWSEVNIALENITEGVVNILDNSQEWFVQKNKLIWSIINSVGSKFISSLEEDNKTASNLSFWFDDSKESDEILKIFLSFGENELLLCLLVITSRIERVFGNIYSESGKEVPFLLKDLLASDILRQKLGKTQIIFLQLLLGCVNGLNLRNIAWHGFFSPAELHQDIVATLFLTLVSLGHQLKDMEFPKRPYMNSVYIEKHSGLLRPFYSSIVLDEHHFMKAVTVCDYISKSHLLYWKYSYNQYLIGRFGYSLILLMPLLENLLRSVFCTVNMCPGRMLTAESTAFYTTLDDILAPITSFGENRIEDPIGKNLLEMLLDLFVYQEGPRLRDKISHAEIITRNIPGSFAKHTFGMSISLILTISKRKGNIKELQEKPFVEFLDICKKYEAIYHPASLLKTALINTIQNVKHWSKFPLPSDMLVNDNDEDFIRLLKPLSEITGYDFSNISNVFAVLSNELSQLHPLTLFRPKYELELISLLRRIIDNIDELNQNISSNCQTKYELWSKKAMKSRVRDNYRRMISFLPLIMLTMAHIFFFMSVTLKELYQQDENKIKFIQRFFKCCLQYVENGVSMSSIKKNRWNELRESSIIVCNLSIEKYNLFIQK